MKYVLLILDTPNEPAPDTAEYGAWYTEVGAWYEKWGATGRLDGGHQLQGTDTAKTVRGGAVTDGPYPEAIGGYTLVDVPSREEALQWAAKIAVACRCAQEVREIGPDPELTAMLRQADRGGGRPADV